MMNFEVVGKDVIITSRDRQLQLLPQLQGQCRAGVRGLKT